jgi:hypothetical protein
VFTPKCSPTKKRQGRIVIKDRQLINGRKKNSDTGLHIHEQLIFDQCAKIIFFSKNGTGAPTVICMEMNFDPYFMLYRKIN